MVKSAMLDGYQDIGRFRFRRNAGQSLRPIVFGRRLFPFCALQNI